MALRDVGVLILEVDTEIKNYRVSKLNPRPRLKIRERGYSEESEAHQGSASSRHNFLVDFLFPFSTNVRLFFPFVRPY